MLPAFDLGPLEIKTYGAMIALAVIVGGMFMFHRLLRLNTSAGVLMRGVIVGIAGGLATAYVVAMIPILAYNALPDFPRPTEGLSVTWVIAGGFFTAIIYCRLCKMPVGRTFDLFVVPVPLAQAIGRLGCFASGDSYGKPTDSWLGIYLPDDHGQWAVRYPTQLMSSATNLAIFIVLLSVERYSGRRRKEKGLPPGGHPFDGFLAILYVILFALKRFLVGFLRENTAPLIGPLSQLQIFALFGIAAALALLAWNLKHLRRHLHAS
ncbi:MAG: prolipoprotein diacylglyceryl transferase [Dehalococcoidia bacterium]|nr:prolipoprotein diacylglyceryl transferase [Dehalococcoidia bacterium]